MKENKWSQTVDLLESQYRVVGQIRVGKVHGSVVHLPGLYDSTSLPKILLKQSWKVGICCKHLYDPEIQKSMDLHEKQMGYRAWIPNEGWMVLFKTVAREDIFTIIGRLCRKFTRKELVAIADLFSTIEWYSPLYACDKHLEIAVPETFSRDIDIEHWYKSYRDVLFVLYGNCVSKSDFKRQLSDSSSVSFVSMK